MREESCCRPRSACLYRLRGQAGETVRCRRGLNVEFLLAHLASLRPARGALGTVESAERLVLAWIRGGTLRGEPRMMEVSWRCSPATYRSAAAKTVWVRASACARCTTGSRGPFLKLPELRAGQARMSRRSGAAEAGCGLSRVRASAGQVNERASDLTSRWAAGGSSSPAGRAKRQHWIYNLPGRANILRRRL